MQLLKIRLAVFAPRLHGSQAPVELVSPYIVFCPVEMRNQGRELQSLLDSQRANSILNVTEAHSQQFTRHTGVNQDAGSRATSLQRPVVSRSIKRGGYGRNKIRFTVDHRSAATPVPMLIKVTCIRGAQQ